MSAQPPTQTPVNWLDARAIKALFVAMLIALVSWAMACAVANAWDWKHLVGVEGGLLLQFLYTLSDPNIIAPVSLLNFRNKT